jgi:hypothetical protein
MGWGMTKVTLYKNIDVEVEIDLDDVTEFISEASRNDHDEIAKSLASHGIHSTLTVLDAATIRHLIERANIFGFTDMLDDLKREGERIGVFLKAEVSA